MTSNRFAVAIHLLTLASAAGAARCGATGEMGGTGEPLTSERMAASVGTHPVVVRRILGALREAGLVSSQCGPGGGWRPTRPPEETTLLDVYRAVTRRPLLSLPPRSAAGACPVGRHVHRTLDAVFGEAEAALERTLAAVTVAEVLAVVRAGMPPLAVVRHRPPGPPANALDPVG